MLIVCKTYTFLCDLGWKSNEVFLKMNGHEKIMDLKTVYSFLFTTKKIDFCHDGRSIIHQSNSCIFGHEIIMEKSRNFISFKVQEPCRKDLLTMERPSRKREWSEGEGGGGVWYRHCLSLVSQIVQ